MSCTCVIQSGKSKGELCARSLKGGAATCGIHKRTCIRRGTPSPKRRASPKRPASPPKRATPRRAPSPRVSPGNVPIKVRVERYIKKLVNSLKEEDFPEMTLARFKEKVKEHFGGEAKYNRDYKKELIKDLMMAKLRSYVHAYLDEIMSTYSVEGYTFTKVKSMVLKRFKDLVEFDDYNEEIQAILAQTKSVLKSAACTPCRDALKESILGESVVEDKIPIVRRNVKDSSRVAVARKLYPSPSRAEKHARKIVYHFRNPTIIGAEVMNVFSTFADMLARKAPISSLKKFYKEHSDMFDRYYNVWSRRFDYPMISIETGSFKYFMFVAKIVLDHQNVFHAWKIDELIKKCPPGSPKLPDLLKIAEYIREKRARWDNGYISSDIEPEPEFSDDE